jgi:hypothetical protein
MSFRLDTWISKNLEQVFSTIPIQTDDGNDVDILRKSGRGQGCDGQLIIRPISSEDIVFLSRGVCRRCFGSQGQLLILRVLRIVREPSLS